MVTKLMIIALGLLVLCDNVIHAMSYTAYLEDAMNDTEHLEDAVNYLVDYTAAETGNVLDGLNIKKRVIDIAQRKLDAKIANDYPRHCNDYNSLNLPTTSGIVRIKPDDGKPFRVYCNMETYGGGWTRIHQRSSDTMTFYRDWRSYKNGFGWLTGDGWLGLEKMHRLTKFQPAELLISIYARNGYYYYPQYGNFSIGSERTGYTLYIGGFTGTGGDYLSYSNLAKFSTYDKDNDSNSGNCASSYRGGWWYYSCAQGKLTGDPYASSTGNNYVKWPGIDKYALYSATMEIRLPNPN